MKVNYPSFIQPQGQRPISITPIIHPNPNIRNLSIPPQPFIQQTIQTRPNILLPNRPHVQIPSITRIPSASNLPLQNVRSFQGIPIPSIQTNMPTSSLQNVLLAQHSPNIQTPLLQSTLQTPSQPVQVETIAVQSTLAAGTFYNPFMSPQNSQIASGQILRNQQAHINGNVILPTIQIGGGSGIYNQQPHILIVNNDSVINPNNSSILQNPLGEHQQQLGIKDPTNHSLIRAQINLNQNNDWQPIQIPKIYTFDYGVHS